MGRLSTSWQPLGVPGKQFEKKKTTVGMVMDVDAATYNNCNSWEKSPLLYSTLCFCKVFSQTVWFLYISGPYLLMKLALWIWLTGNGPSQKVNHPGRVGVGITDTEVWARTRRHPAPDDGSSSLWQCWSLVWEAEGQISSYRPED